MVKGITKQVVVVRCPDTEYFDQAIFMVKDSFQEGANPEQLLREATRAADDYIRANVGRKRRISKWWLLVLAGAAVLAAVLFAVLR